MLDLDIRPDDESCQRHYTRTESVEYGNKEATTIEEVTVINLTLWCCESVSGIFSQRCALMRDFVVGGGTRSTCYIHVSTSDCSFSHHVPHRFGVQSNRGVARGATAICIFFCYKSCYKLSKALRTDARIYWCRRDVRSTGSVSIPLTIDALSNIPPCQSSVQ